MAKFMFLVCTKPVEGREDEYNKWYNEVHLHDLLAVPGCVAAQRWEAAPGQPELFGYHYIATYEWEADSVEACQAALAKNRETANNVISDALDKGAITSVFFSPVEP